MTKTEHHRYLPWKFEFLKIIASQRLLVVMCLCVYTFLSPGSEVAMVTFTVSWPSVSSLV